MPTARPLITLLTDFGTTDYFVASMKGVILTINPAASIVDLSHHIPPHQIALASYCLEACYRMFPEGTVHVVVVDPGVGSRRRPILVQTSRYYFVAPDNGVLTAVLNLEQDIEIRHLENQRYQLKPPGTTFHGRDLFAPAAAWLTLGTALSSFGGLISDPVRMSRPQPVVKGGRLVGEIVYIDRFGNLISNISLGQLETVDTGRLQIRVGTHVIEKLVSNYSEGRAEVPHALINSNGMLELFLKERPADALLQIGLGAEVELTGAEEDYRSC